MFQATFSNSVRELAGGTSTSFLSSLFENVAGELLYLSPSVKHHFRKSQSPSTPDLRDTTCNSEDMTKWGENIAMETPGEQFVSSITKCTPIK